MAGDSPLHVVAQQLARSAQASRIGRHVEVDGLALAAIVDQELGRFLSSRRGAVLQALSLRMSRAASLVQAIENGLSTDDAGAAALELASIAAGLRVLAAMSAAPRAA